MDNIDYLSDTACDYYDVSLFNSNFVRKDVFVFHLNICSFHAHFDELSVLLDSLIFRPSVIVLTETWFSEGNIHDIDGYVGYHTYRQTRGGGVSVYVCNSLGSYILNDFSFINDIVETCAVKVILRNSISINIVGVYRPPNSGNLHNFNVTFFNDVVTKFDARSNVVVVGDLNVNLINPTGNDLELIENFHSYILFR